jgi:hypothetical protein
MAYELEKTARCGMKRRVYQNVNLKFGYCQTASRLKTFLTDSMIVALAAPLAAHSAHALEGQNPDKSSARVSGSYFVAYRTPHHIQASPPEVFHTVADGVEEFLKFKHVLLATDPERPKFQTQAGRGGVPLSFQRGK